jgi:hypothetical protein
MNYFLFSYTFKRELDLSLEAKTDVDNLLLARDRANSGGINDNFKRRFINLLSKEYTKVHFSEIFSFTEHSIIFGDVREMKFFYEFFNDNLQEVDFQLVQLVTVSNKFLSMETKGAEAYMNRFRKFVAENYDSGNMTARPMDM